MDNPIPELSPDLEWMLESGQASSEMLADALAREYFQPVYRLGLALFNDPKQAEWLAVDSLSAALMQSYSYHGGSVQAWLFRIVLDRYRRNRRKFSHRNEAHNWKPDDGSAAVVPFVENTDERLWGAIRKINRKKHLPFLLTYLYQWPNELVADILEVEPKTIIGQLKLVRHRLIEVLSAPDYPTEGLAYERLDASIHELLERRWPGMSLDADKFQAIMEDVIAGAEQQRSRHLNLGLGQRVHFSRDCHRIGGRVYLWRQHVVSGTRTNRINGIYRACNPPGRSGTYVHSHLHASTCCDDDANASAFASHASTFNIGIIIQRYS